MKTKITNGKAALRRRLFPFFPKDHPGLRREYALALDDYRRRYRRKVVETLVDAFLCALNAAVWISGTGHEFTVYTTGLLTTLVVWNLMECIERSFDYKRMSIILHDVEFRESIRHA